MKDANNALTFAPSAVRNAPNATMSSAYPVTFAVNVRERTLGAQTVASAATVPTSARTAVRFAPTVHTRYAKSAASAPVALTSSAPNATPVSNARTLCARIATGARTALRSYAKSADITAPNALIFAPTAVFAITAPIFAPIAVSARNAA